MEAELYTLLSGSTPIAALVGTRIYPMGAEQDDALPYVTYTNVSTEPMHSLPRAGDRWHGVFQLDCWAATFTSAVAVAEAVRNRCDGYQGTVGSRVIDTRVQSRSTDVEPPIDASDKGVYRVTMELKCIYTQAAPSDLT